MTQIVRRWKAQLLKCYILWADGDDMSCYKARSQITMWPSWRSRVVISCLKHVRTSGSPGMEDVKVFEEAKTKQKTWWATNLLDDWKDNFRRTKRNKMHKPKWEVPQNTNDPTRHTLILSQTMIIFPLTLGGSLSYLLLHPFLLFIILKNY